MAQRGVRRGARGAQALTAGREWPEKRFQASVVILARLRGWWAYSVPDSRRSAAGWPDLALLRPPRLLLRELKTDRGRLRSEQREVMAALSACGLDVKVWRPSMWEEIEHELA